VTVFGDFQNHALSIPAECGGVKVEGGATALVLLLARNRVLGCGKNPGQ
jgi:hypothetical protein